MDPSTRQIRLAHISDLHYGRPTLNPLQFFSKRWVGNFNLLLNRQCQFDHSRLDSLIDLFLKEEVTHVIISGDLSVTARRREFAQALRFTERLKEAGIAVFTIPGNHDHYTRRAFRKKLFYRYFPSKWSDDLPFDLVENKVTGLSLTKDLWLVALDTAIATPLTSSRGLFTSTAEENLEKALNLIPKEARVILINHFPFFQNDVPKKRLMRGPILQNLLQKHRNVRLYLHGHTHRQTIANLSTSELPIIADTGCTPHRKQGACYILTPLGQELKLDTFTFDKEWTRQEEHTFKW